MKSIKLQLPQFNKSNLINTYAQVRPYREGGNRLDYEKWNNKCLIHNYGHGGAGISLAYGSALLTAQLAIQNRNVKAIKECAVMGAGIIGLMSALQLNKLGFKVTVYAQKFPEITKDNNKMITSQVAPGFWLPYSSGSHNMKMLDQISKTSYQYYSQCIRQKKYKSIRFVDAYIDKNNEEMLKTFTIKEMINSLEKVLINFGGKYHEQMHKFRTLQFEMQQFMLQLKKQCQIKNIKFIHKQFLKKSEISQLHEQLIINCLANSNYLLFDDKKMKSVRGHLLQFKNQNPQKFNYILRKKIGNFNGAIYCLPNRILFGLTRQEGKDKPQVDQNIVQMLIQKSKDFSSSINKQLFKPKL